MTANFHELLQKAIAIEARMAEFYDAMAKKATLPETRKIFKNLAEEENEHRFSLENYLEIGIFPQIPKSWEPDLDTVLNAVGSITPEMAPNDALALVIRSEECQHKFYEKLSMEYPSGLVHNFLKRMADMELAHKERVEKFFR
jgi:rubrerythrin